MRMTRANNPYLSDHVHPSDVANSDSDSLDYLELDEDAPGDASYLGSGDTNEPAVDWIEVYFPSANIPQGSTVNNITYYYGYYTNDGWGLTTDSTSNITWRVDATEHDLENYTLSSPPDTDIDVSFKQTTGLPSLSHLNSGNFKVRFRGVEDGGGDDRFYLDYCYFTINYSIPNIVFNEIQFDPSGSDDNSEWVELYNAGNSAVDLNGWNLTDNDGNRFNLSSAGSFSAGSYLVCHLAQTGTNSSTDVYDLIRTEFVIQPDSSTGVDNYLSNATTTTNYGTISDLIIENTSTTQRRSIVQFDLTTVPAKIADAQVMLYHSSGNSNSGTYYVHRVTQSWTEGGSTWMTYDGTNNWAISGGDYDGTSEGSETISGSDDTWYSWDITSLTSAWKAGTYGNYGVIFTSAVDSTWKGFYSSDYTTDTTLIPKLVVTHYTSDSMLETNDDLALLDNNNIIIDYVAWGADPGSDDDDAVAAGQWTAGNYVDTTGLSEGASLGRDKDSNDTDLPADWEHPSTSQADPYGVNATVLTQGARNLDIPEFEHLIFPMMFIALVYFCFSKSYRSKYDKFSNYKKSNNNEIKSSNSTNKKVKY
jgi:hypothetical protein